MRNFLKTFLGRSLSIFLATVMTYASASAGVNAAVVALMNRNRESSTFDVSLANRKTLLQSLSRGATQYVGGYTDVPGPVYLGARPGRDMGRGGIWNEHSLQLLRAASLYWGATPDEVGAVASLHPAFRPGTTGDDEGTGSGFPWETPYYFGPYGCWLNTSTGNIVTPEPIVSFPSVGDTGISLTLFHNSQASFDDTLGKGWSTNYDARVVGNPGSDVIVRWGDGTCIPYSYQSSTGTYVAPNGVHDQLSWTMDFWQIVKPDQTRYQFFATSVYPNSGRLFLITDRNLNNVDIGHDAAGHVNQVFAPDGRTLQLGYTMTGKLYWVVDPQNRVWNFSYDTDGNLYEVSNPPLGGVTYKHRYTYFNGRILSQTDELGRTWNYNYGYGPSGSSGPYVLKGVTSPLGNQTQFDYTTSKCTVTLPRLQTTDYNYSSGRVTSVMDFAGYSTSVNYDSDNNVISCTDKRSKTSNFTWDASGNLLTATDPLNHTTTFTYNSTNDVLTVKDALNQQTTFTYDVAGNLQTVLDPMNRQSSFTYNSYGQMITSADPLSNVTTFAYNPKGDVIAVSDPLGHQTIATFTNLNNIVSVTDALGNMERFTRDAWERMIGVKHPNNSTATLTLDVMGQVTQARDENGHISYFTYDSDGNLTDAQNPNANIQHWEYDANGWLTKSRNPRGYERSYFYYGTGIVSRITLPDGQYTDFTYNANGQVTSAINSGGATGALSRGYVYDDGGKLTKIDFPGAAIDTTISYDAINRALGTTDTQGSTSFQYNSDSQTTQIATPQGTVNYSYDSNGRPSVMQRIGAGQTHYYYDNASRLTSLTNQYNQTTTFTYDVADRLTQQADANGTYTNYGYDDRSRLTSLTKYKNPSTAFRTETYSYNDNSTLAHKMVDGVTTFYAYDNAGQLQGETAPTWSNSYTYDPNGNRSTKTENPGAVTDTYFYDNADKLTNITSTSSARNKTFTYDINGQTKTIATSAGTTTFNYNNDGMVSGITYPSTATNSFLYNGMGARVKRTDSGTGPRTFVRDGLAPASPVLYDSAINFTPGVSERSSSGQDRYYNDDGLGSATDVTDLNGNILASRTWDAFGVQKTGSSLTYLRGYHEDAGYEEDKDSSLKLLGYRYYDPSIGRFLTQDPIGAGSNWYAYCDNDPLSYCDPLGLLWRQIGSIAGGIIGGAIFGPFGAVIGAGLGGAIGSYSDGSSLQEAAFDGAIDGATEAIGYGIGKAVITGVKSYRAGRTACVASEIGEGVAAAASSGVGKRAAILKANQINGAAAEEVLRKSLGNAGRERFVVPNLGARTYDAFRAGGAHEAKVGFTKLSKVARQVAKDTYLLQNNKVSSVTWHFYRSPITDLVGPNKALREALENAGIGIVSD